MISNSTITSHYSNLQATIPEFLSIPDLFVGRTGRSQSGGTTDGYSGVGGAGIDSIFSGTTGLTAEGLILYLQTRMNSLDEQINAIFSKMQDMEKIRKLVNNMQNELNSLNDDTSKKDIQGTQHTGGPSGYELTLFNYIDAIGQIDPGLADSLRTQMGAEGQILYGTDGRYFTSEVSNSRELLNSVSKQLESSAQLDMIKLQSLTSTRGTVIQMATNTLSTFHDSLKTVAHNIK